MKIRHVFDFDDRAGELAERLRHEPRLQPHLRFAHLAFDFGFRHQRGHRVDHDDVDAVRADEHFDDLERLLAVVGLRDEQVVDVDAQLLRISRVERVFGIDERRHPAQLLRFRDDLQRQRRLARRLGPEDLDDAAARHAADAEREVDARWRRSESQSIGWMAPFWPRRMIEPLPNCFSIWPTARSTALRRSLSWAGAAGLPRSIRSIRSIRSTGDMRFAP